jgi:hypothetical protein
MFRRSNRLSVYGCKNVINKANLNINLITELDLTGVPVVADMSGNGVPVAITNNAIPYLDYNIDPCGNLFGNSVCGINNFTGYIKYDAPYNYISYVSEDYGGADSINAFDIPAFTNWHCPVTNEWYKVTPNGYIIPFSETGLTTPNSVMSIAFLYDNLNNFGNWRNIFQFGYTNSDTRYPSVYIIPNSSALHIRFATNNGGNDGMDTISLPMEPLLITMVFNGNNFTFYFNKTQSYTGNFNGIKSRTSDMSLIIGNAFHPTDGNIFIKDYTLYDGALSQTDVNNIYDNLTNMPPA